MEGSCMRMESINILLLDCGKNKGIIKQVDAAFKPADDCEYIGTYQGMSCWRTLIEENEACYDLTQQWPSDAIRRGYSKKTANYHQKIQLDGHQRIILISDIHGNRSLFHKLLKKCRYQPDDVLILLGDLGEKGNDSLGVLYDVMLLCEQGNTYVVQGNCDCLVPSLMRQPLKDFVGYNNFRKESLLNEMAHECGYLHIDMENGEAVRQAIADKFKKALTFIENLPLVIESEASLFVHAGLMNEEIPFNTRADFITYPAFMESGKRFKKHVYCGHWPTLNYRMDIADCKVYTDKKMNATAIDGGNGVKSEGQLNALILHQGQAECIWVDELKRAIVQKEQAASEDPIFISWAKREVVKLETKGQMCYCEHLASKRKVWLPLSYLYEEEDKLCCMDFTNYLLPVKAGDEVSLIEEKGDYVFAKLNGVVGWIRRECF